MNTDNERAPGARRILIIDNDTSIREMFSHKLAQEGFNVRQAEDGALGLADAISQKPDIILLDVMMPKMNGLEVIREIRAEGEWGAKVPVIFLTNVVPEQESQLDTITNTTPAFYLIKSNTTPGELAAKVNEVLSA